jgi:hypothetical protein
LSLQRREPPDIPPLKLLLPPQNKGWHLAYHHPAPGRRRQGSPPKTAAFWDIVNANSAPEDAELADVLEALGSPDALTLGHLIDRASGTEAAEWLMERRNRRAIPHRMERCGYAPVRNPDADDGRWKLQDGATTRRRVSTVPHLKRGLALPGHRPSVHAEILERILAFAVAERSTATKAGQRMFCARCCFHPHQEVFRLARRASKLCRILHGRDLMVRASARKGGRDSTGRRPQTRSRAASLTGAAVLTVFLRAGLSCSFQLAEG